MVVNVGGSIAVRRVNGSNFVLPGKTQRQWEVGNQDTRKLAQGFAK